MGSIFPFAISIHKFVSSAGADAGFAAIIGLAILVLLYFAQARETATLREQASEAADRVNLLEARIAELARQTTPAPAAQAAPARSRSAVPAGLGAAAAASGAAAGVASGARPLRPPVPIGAPAGVAAPALAAATRLIPLATDNGAGGGARIDWPDEPIDVQRAENAPAPANVAAGNGASHDRVPPVPAPPRRRMETGPAAPVRAAGRATAVPRRPLIPPEPPRRRSPLLKPLIALLGVAVVGGGIAALLVLTSGKATRHSSTVASRTTNAPVPSQPVAFNPRTVTVAVLNGTGTTGLAHRTALRLAVAGYRQGTVATATDQTQTVTQIAYLPGYKSDAIRVAGTLKLSSAAVQPIDPGTRAVACPPPAACTANVVVTVGADLASVY
jgi:hypothetical protein